MLLERTQAQVSHSCRKAWKETAKRTRARAPPWPFHRFPWGPANLWLLLEENHSALFLAHEPWSPPAFTKTQFRIRAVTGRARFQFVLL